MPSLAKGDDARLLYFLHPRTARARAYNVVTLTAIRDGAAWEQLVHRLHDGDLRPWAATSTSCVTGSPPRCSSPCRGRRSRSSTWRRCRRAATTRLTLFMEDTAWPYEGGLEEYLEAARTNYAPSLAEGGRTGRSLLELQAVFRPAWGAGRWREVVLWQKVTQLKAITPLVTTEVPPEYRRPARGCTTPSTCATTGRASSCAPPPGRRCFSH